MEDVVTGTMEEQTADLERQLIRDYGERVAVEYVDIFSPRMADYRGILRIIARGDIPLPLIAVDGKPRFVGGISLEMISGDLDGLGLARLS